MRTQRQIAQWIVGRGGHYLLTVKASQKTLHRVLRHRVLRDLTWRDVPAVSSVEAGHGRRVRCILKAADAPAWIDFPGAARVIRVRRTRTTTKRKGGNGKGRSVEVVHPGPLPAYDPGPVRAGRCLGPGALEDGEPDPPGTRRGLRPGTATSCAPATARRSWPRCVTWPSSSTAPRLAAACIDAVDLSADSADAEPTESDRWLGLARSALARSWLHDAPAWKHVDVLLRVAPDLTMRRVEERLLVDLEPRPGSEGPGGGAASSR